MNRIQLLDHNVAPSTQTSRSFNLKSAGQSAVEHSFFVPLHYEPNYAYPLLVWLHGPGESHSELKQVMPHVSMRNYVAVAPDWLQPSDDDELLSPEAKIDQDRHLIIETMYRVNECVAMASKRFNIAADRVFLAGYDQGGTMALRLGLAAPDHFAGASSMGGPVPTGLNPLANLIEARRLPMMIAHGQHSQSYAISRICDELRLFHVAGLSLNLRQYPCGHELTTQMLSDLDAWMMQIVTGVDSTSSSSAGVPYDDRN
jgi:phospholipase/carboxylesterase